MRRRGDGLGLLGLVAILAIAGPDRALAHGDGPRALDASEPHEGTRDTAPYERVRTGSVMGTDLKITVLGDDPTRLEAALDAAEAELRRVEDLMTDWRESPLTRLNAQAGRGPQVVPEELALLVDRGQRWGERTDGAFDLAFAAVGRLWRFETDHPTLPDPEAVREALRHTDARRIVVDLEASTVDLPDSMAIGLGGIAKGYGVDRAMDVLLRMGIHDAIVNAGGDMKVLGRDHGRPWEVAIKNPRDREAALAVLRVSNTCVVTSGDYERFFEIDGQRYHHILDPRTGYPSKGAMSATVVGPSAADADALATALCVLGPERGLPIVEKMARVEALLVDMQGKVWVSTGLKGLVGATGSGD